MNNLRFDVATLGVADRTRDRFGVDVAHGIPLPQTHRGLAGFAIRPNKFGGDAAGTGRGGPGVR
jgi:hypothetical protein